MRLVTAAVVRQTGGEFHLEDLQLEDPRQTEVVVRILGSGICHTDVSARDQVLPFRLPAVLGHEGAGVVEAVGSAVTRVRRGDHVVLSFAHCGACTNCSSEHPAYCTKTNRLNFGGARADGSAVQRDAAGAVVSSRFIGQSAFASCVLVDERTVIVVPSDLPVELMGPLGCSMQTGAGAVLNVLRAEPGSSIAIFGSGAVGLAAVMASRIAECATIIAIDLNDDRLRSARELGATHTFNATQTDCVDAVRAVMSGRGVRYAVECTGRASVLGQALEVLDICGTCALVGAADPSALAPINMNAMLRGRSLLGVTEGDTVPQQFIPRLIDWWREGRFPFDRLVTYFALSQINEAVRACASGTVIKAIVRPQQRP